MKCKNPLCSSTRVLWRGWCSRCYYRAYHNGVDPDNDRIPLHGRGKRKVTRFDILDYASSDATLGEYCYKKKWNREAFTAAIKDLMPS